MRGLPPPEREAQNSKARTLDGCARALLPQMALSRFSRHVMGLRYYKIEKSDQSKRF